MFLFILFDFVFSSYTSEQLKVVFTKGLSTKREQAQHKKSLMESDSENEKGDTGEDRLADFRRGMSEYLLTKFYLKKKTEGALESEIGLKDKFRVCFDIINKE